MGWPIYSDGQHDSHAVQQAREGVENARGRWGVCWSTLTHFPLAITYCEPCTRLTR